MGKGRGNIWIEGSVTGVVIVGGHQRAYYPSTTIEARLSEARTYGAALLCLPRHMRTSCLEALEASNVCKGLSSDDVRRVMDAAKLAADMSAS